MTRWKIMDIILDVERIYTFDFCGNIASIYIIQPKMTDKIHKKQRTFRKNHTSITDKKHQIKIHNSILADFRNNDYHFLTFGCMNPACMNQDFHFKCKI